MTAAIIKTKAEQALAADFAARGKDLPGTGAIAKSRGDAMAAFERRGLPHRRVEEWKYTDLRAALKDFAPIATHDDAAVSIAEITAALGPLGALDADRIVFVNGSHRPELSTAKPQTTVQTLAAALRAGRPPAQAKLPADEAVVALNAALVTDGALIEIKDGATLSKPLLIVSVAAGPKAKLVSLRHVMKAGRGSKATIIDAHIALGGAVASQSNAVVEIAAGDGAAVTHVLVSLEGGAATHVETIAATLGAAVTFKLFQLNAGIGLARNQTFATFAGEDSKLDISGLMLGRARQHCDTTLVIDHAVPGCE